MFTENSPYRGFLVSFYMQAQGQHYAGLDIPQWRLTYMFDKLVNALDEWLDSRKTTSVRVLLIPLIEYWENGPTA